MTIPEKYILQDMRNSLLESETYSFDLLLADFFSPLSGCAGVKWGKCVRFGRSSPQEVIHSKSSHYSKSTVKDLFLHGYT